MIRDDETIPPVKIPDDAYLCHCGRHTRFDSYCRCVGDAEMDARRQWEVDDCPLRPNPRHGTAEFPCVQPRQPAAP